PERGEGAGGGRAARAFAVDLPACAPRCGARRAPGDGSPLPRAPRLSKSELHRVRQPLGAYLGGGQRRPTRTEISCTITPNKSPASAAMQTSTLTTPSRAGVGCGDA